MSFKISINPALRERLLELHAEAAQFGQEVAFKEALEVLVSRLQVAPIEAGEICFRLSQGEPVLVAAEAPVVIDYAVYEIQGIVWVYRVHRLTSAQE